MNEVIYGKDTNSQDCIHSKKDVYKDWGYLFILAIGMALGVLLAHPLIINSLN